MWQAHRFRQIQITNTNKDMRRARIAIVEEHIRLENGHDLN
jgi:hypothetical protein